MLLHTIGSGYWPVAKRVEAICDCLKRAGVELLIDARHSPCASQLDPGSQYGPREWNLQSGGNGIEQMLKSHGISYLWLVELGNPQKNDPGMAVLREQLASAHDRWPVNRGLQLLADTLSKGKSCALLCACADYRHCHRTLIAEAARARFPKLNIEIKHLR
jgi:uncharacterized protein (DUF488 family)